MQEKHRRGQIIAAAQAQAARNSCAGVAYNNDANCTQQAAWHAPTLTATSAPLLNSLPL
jgi:hypothetical protein